MLCCLVQRGTMQYNCVHCTEPCLFSDCCQNVSCSSDWGSVEEGGKDRRLDSWTVGRMEGCYFEFLTVWKVVW